jgi:peptide/nickel transport system substrate-binding protein
MVHAINYTAIIGTVEGFGQTFVGPETPNYGQFYNPGNLPPYSYNLTLAANYLTEAGFPGGKGLPPLELDVDQLGQTWQVPAAEIIQADLAQIGITINIQVVQDSVFYSPVGSYSSELSDPSAIAPLRIDDPKGYAPDYLAPTDYWLAFVTNSSTWANWAIYNNPVVDRAGQVMQHSNNNAVILQQMTLGYKQIYDDAPYAWLFVPTTIIDNGSYAYNTQVIGGFYIDWALTGNTDVPLLNTIYPAA